MTVFFLNLCRLVWGVNSLLILIFAFCTIEFYAVLNGNENVDEKRSAITHANYLPEWIEAVTWFLLFGIEPTAKRVSLLDRLGMHVLFPCHIIHFSPFSLFVCVSFFIAIRIARTNVIFSTNTTTAAFILRTVFSFTWTPVEINRIQLNRNVLENDWNYKLDLSD